MSRVARSAIPEGSRPKAMRRELGASPRKVMRGNFNQMMKQAQAMQANMQKAQAELANLEVVGESGGGMVKVTLNGRHEAKRVQIEPSVVAGEDREMLEDLLTAAFNDAVHKLEALVQEKMASLMSGMQLPPGVKMPF